MLLQHLIYSAKDHPWWIVGALVCPMILTTLRSLVWAKPQASKNPEFLPVPLVSEEEQRDQLNRKTCLGILRRKGFHSACQVLVLTRQVPGLPPLVVARYIHSVEMSLQSWEYELSVDGYKFKVRHADSAWEVYL